MEEIKKVGKITDGEQMKKLVKGKYSWNKLNRYLLIPNFDTIRALEMFVSWHWNSYCRVREEWNAQKLCRPSVWGRNDQHHNVSAVSNGTNPWQEVQITSCSVSSWYQYTPTLCTQVSVVTEMFLDLSLPVSDEVIIKMLLGVILNTTGFKNVIGTQQAYRKKNQKKVQSSREATSSLTFPSGNDDSPSSKYQQKKAKKQAKKQAKVEWIFTSHPKSTLNSFCCGLDKLCFLPFHFRLKKINLILF